MTTAEPFDPAGSARSSPSASVPASPAVAPRDDHASDVAAPRRVPFVFTATGGGYFRLWIVNLLLTIVTAGLYSPWAKVRRLRYFYGNTLVDGSPFEFHGRPFALLKGRLVGLALVVAYSLAPRVSFTLWLVVAAVLFAILPWLLWKSLRFRFANASWRGLRFAFDGTVGQAYATFLPLMAMVLGPTAVITLAQRGATPEESLRMLGTYYAALGVAALFSPWFLFRLRAYQHRHARLGQASFAFDGRVAGAYGVAFFAVLFAIGSGIAATFAGAVGGALAGGVAWMATASDGRAAWSVVGIVAGVAVGYAVLIGTVGFYRAMIQNFVWRHSTLAGARFASTAQPARLWGIDTFNVFATLVTLGFFWPFAVVRSTRYRVEAIAWRGDPDALAAGVADARVGATGEETADLFGLDIAL